MSRLLPVMGTIFLLLVTAISAQLVLDGTFQTTNMMPARDIQPDAEPETMPAGTSLREARPQSYYSAITERPLFEVTRRPIDLSEPEMVINDVARVEPIRMARLPEIQLMGVLLSGEQPSVFLSVEGDKAKWLRQGDTVQSWVLEQVASDYVEFKNNKEVVRIDLYNNKRAD